MLINQKPRIFDVDLIGLALVAALFGATYLFGVRTLQQNYQEQLRQREEFSSQTEASQARLAGLRELTQQQKMLTDRLQQTRDVLRESTGMDEVVRQLGLLAESCAIRITEINPEEVSGEPSYVVTKVSLKCGGTFLQTRRFLVQLQQQMPFVRVAAFSINAIEQSDRGLCRVEMDLRVYAPNEF